MQVVSLIGLKHVFYLVLYIPDDDTQVVTIIRVMYGGRDVDTQLKRFTKKVESINQKWLVLFSCLKKSVFYAHFYGRRYRPWLTELWVLLSRLAKIPPNYRLASCIIQSVGKIKNYISSTFHKRCVE